MRKLSVVRQLSLLIVSFVMVTLAGLCGLSYELHRASADSQRLAADAQAKGAASLEVVNIVSDVQSAVQRIVRERDPDSIEKLLEQTRSLTAAARKIVGNSGAAGSELAAAMEKLTAANDKAIAALLQGDYAQAQQCLIEESNPAFDSILHVLKSAQAAGERQLQQAAARSAADAFKRQLLLWVFVCAGIACVLGFAFLITRNIRAGLQEGIAELRNAAAQVAGSAGQVSGSAQSLSEGAGEQAASLEEASSTAGRISAVVGKNAGNSDAIAGLMLETAKTIDDTNRRVAQLVASMNDIRTSSGKISKIIKVIDEIAFQTNILALNAAVEAARAGEAGAGFAVVADEVRSLAQRSAQAANETTALIQESVTKAGEGNERLNRVAESMRIATDVSGKARSLVEELGRSGQEQMRGMEEIARVISRMDQVTQRNAAEADQGAAAGAELTSQSAILDGVVEQLNRLVGAAR